MLDKLHLFVPFRLEHITLLGADGRSDSVHYVDINGLGVPLQGQVQQREDGGYDAEHLRHAWESLSTGYTPLAFKVFNESLGKRLMPGVEIKASPAKLLQGHNVFGPTCIQKGAEVMLKWLAGSYPKLYAMLDIRETQVYNLDCTFSARLPNERTALQVITALRGTSNGQTQARGDTYETTAYWGSKDSRLKKLKAYLKHPEFLRQIEEAKRSRIGRADPEPRRDLHNAHVREWKREGQTDLSAYRTLKVLSNPNLQEWAKNLLRFEATVMHRWLERRGLSSRLVDLIAHQQQLQEEGRCFIQECWQAVTAPIFAAFEGMTMKQIDDEKVLAALTDRHMKYDRKGQPNDSHARNLFRTYRSIKDYGWEETMSSMSRATFYRHVTEICESGLSKAALQKLHEVDKGNVVPLLRFVAVDFSAQRPHWYVEPSVEAA